MRSKDPQRWIEPGSDAPPELQAAFEAGTRDGPSPERVEKIAVALGVPFPPPGGGTPQSGSSSASGGTSSANGSGGSESSTVGSAASSSSSLWLGGGIALLAVALAIGGISLLSRGQREMLQPQQSEVAPEIEEPPGAGDSEAPARTGDSEAPARTGDSELHAFVAALSSENEAASLEEEREPRAEESTIRRSTPRRSPPPGQDGGLSSTDLAAEARLLEQARGALASSPRRSLRIAEQHRREFRRGVLAQEREILAIDALQRLGRTEAARRRAEHFRRRWPSSGHRRRVERILGDGRSADQ